MRIGGVTMSQAGAVPYGRNVSGRTNGQGTCSKNGNSAEIREKKRMLSQPGSDGVTETENGQKVFKGASKQSVVSGIRSSADALKAARTKTKDASLAIKHVRYQAKSLSSQIVRSKTASSCRQAAGRARREVVRLRRLLKSDTYDEDELRSAILHAQAMERVAKKKLRHIEQEEAVRVTKERESGQSEDAYLQQELSGEEALEEDPREMPESSQEQEYQMPEWPETLLENAGSDGQDQLLAQMQETLQELLEETGASDLMEELSGPVKKEMGEEEFKDFRRKHRLAEMKELVKADCDYLKASFERLQKTSGAVPGAVVSGANPFGGGIDCFV